MENEVHEAPAPLSAAPVVARSSSVVGWMGVLERGVSAMATRKCSSAVLFDHTGLIHEQHQGMPRDLQELEKQIQKLVEETEQSKGHQ